MSSPRSTPLLIVLGVVALGAVAWLLFHFSGGEASPPPAEFDPAGVARESGAEELPAGLSGDDPSESLPPAERAEVLAKQEGETTASGPERGPTQWLRGRVVLPADTPADERLFVLCLDRSSGADRLYGGEGLAEAAWDPEIDRQGLLAKALVEGDGRFRIAVPADASSTHLALSGRYLYSVASTEFPLPAGDVGVTIGGELGAWITGSLRAPVPATGAPPALVGLTAKLGPDLGGLLDPTRIDRFGYQVNSAVHEDHTFEFRAITHEIGHLLFIRCETLAVHLQAGLRPRPGEHLRLDLYLKDGARLAGRVVDEAGVGLADVEVGVRLPGPIGESAGDLRVVQSGDDGGFLLEHVHLGNIVLHAKKEGFRQAKLPIEDELTDGQEIAGLELVLTKGSSIAGTVRFPGGAPAVGAALNVSPDISAMMSGGIPGAGFDPRDGGKDEVAADGTFRVDGLGDGTFKVTARIEVEEEEGNLTGIWSAGLAGARGGTDDLALELEKLETVRGRVTDLLGEPVPDFRLRATLQGSGGLLGIGAEKMERPITDSEDGTFVLEGLLRSGTWDFKVTAHTYASGSLTDVELPQSEVDAELLFVLEPAAGVSGTVLDSFGNPIGGASVSRERTLAEGIANSDQEPETAVSDAKGEFLLTGLDPGTHAILARKEGFAASEAISVEMLAGEVVEGVVLRLRVGGLLTGEVLGPEGKPAVGRMIIVRSNDNPLKQRLMPSDANGEFRVEHLEPGGYQVLAMANFMTGEVDLGGDNGLNDILGDLKMAMADIVDGEETHVVLGKPPEDPVTLVGRVVHSGEPVPRVMVSLIPEAGRGMGDMKIVTTDETGSFTMELAKRGSCLITVQNVFSPGMQNSVEFREHIPLEGDRHEVTLELPHGRISGRILGPDGEPAAGCRVTLSVDGGIALGSFLGGNYADVSADDEGNYDIPYLRPGTYTISAGGSLLGGMLGDNSSMGRVVRCGVRVSEGQWLSGVDFRLDEPGELIGYVESFDGAPAAGASVYVRDGAGRLLERFSMVVTDSSGRFTYPGLAPGDYTFTAAQGNDVSANSDVIHVPEGGRGEGRVALEAGTTLQIRVVDKTGAGLKAWISVLDPEGRELSGMLSLPTIVESFSEGFAADAQKVGPLPPGKYRVNARLEDGRETYKRVSLSGSQETRKVVLRIK